MKNIKIAINYNNAIVKNNQLLYHISEDLKHFKILTTGHKIIMGTKTFLSLPDTKPLVGRDNIILTRNKKDFVDKIASTHPYRTFDNLIVCTDLQDLINTYKDSKEEIFVIGGSEIYNQFLPYANRIYLTQIKDNLEGDKYFEFNKDDFDLEEFEERTSKDGPVYRFENYIRKQITENTVL